MTTIEAVEAHDVRFPTSQTLDGSDAMNKDGDYSAAYVVIRTDDPELSGYGFTFTIGRGNDIVTAAALHWAVRLIGRDLDTVVSDREAKLKLYASRGVQEYWIVDWRVQQVELYRREHATLRLIETLFVADTLTTPLLPNFTCQVARLFA
jgi:hypothetical protein